MLRRNGLSLIEVLVAIVILGVILAVIIMPIANLFGVTQRSNDELRLTTQAQQITEFIRGQWQNNPDLYDRGCYQNLPAAVAGTTVTVTLKALDLTGAETGTIACQAAAPPVPPPLQRIEVTVTQTSSNDVVNLVVDVANPTP